MQSLFYHSKKYTTAEAMVYVYDYCVISFHNFYRYRAAHDAAQLYAGGIFITDRNLVIVGLTLCCTLVNVVGLGGSAKFLVAVDDNRALKIMRRTHQFNVWIQNISSANPISRSA